jgi:hypothetical protein
MLLNAMAAKFDIGPEHPVRSDFNLAKQAFIEHSSWASAKSAPTAEYFQAHPCELLRVRGLDLSAVPEITSGLRGVRVFMPIDTVLSLQDKPANERLFADYLRLARQTMNAYLVSVLEADSPAFAQMWTSLVDLYIAGSDVRERFMRKCNTEEEPTDISFD